MLRVLPDVRPRSASDRARDPFSVVLRAPNRKQATWGGLHESPRLHCGRQDSTQAPQRDHIPARAPQCSPALHSVKLKMERENNGHPLTPMTDVRSRNPRNPRSAIWTQRPTTILSKPRLHPSILRRTPGSSTVVQVCQRCSVEGCRESNDAGKLPDVPTRGRDANLRSKFAGVAPFTFLANACR